MAQIGAARGSVVGGRLAAGVYEHLKAELISGEHEAGSELVVADLRQKYGVSKQPIMEALRALASDRLIQIQPQVGVRVSRYSAAEVEGFFLLFSRTEGTMARQAALTRTDADVRALTRACDELESLAHADRSAIDPTYLRGNRRIHTLVHEMARTPLSSGISESLWDLSDFLITTHIRSHDSEPGERPAGHREVLAAIRDQDAERAETAMSRHILTSRGRNALA